MKPLIEHDPSEPITQQTALLRFSVWSFHIDPRIWLLGFSWEPHGNVFSVYVLPLRFRLLVPPKAFRARALRLVQSPAFWLMVTSIVMLSLGIGIGVMMVRTNPSIPIGNAPAPSIIADSSAHSIPIPGLQASTAPSSSTAPNEPVQKDSTMDGGADLLVALPPTASVKEPDELKRKASVAIAKPIAAVGSIPAARESAPCSDPFYYEGGVRKLKLECLTPAFPKSASSIGSARPRRDDGF